MKKNKLDEIFSESLLRLIADKGEIDAVELLALVPRIHNDHIDFYPLAGLLHAGFISTTSRLETGDGEKIVGKLGKSTRDTAGFLQQLTLRQGETYTFNNTQRDPVDFPIEIFVTAEGYLRLDELSQRKLDRSRKRNDYLMTAMVAICAAILSTALTHYFAMSRLTVNSNVRHAVEAAP